MKIINWIGLVLTVACVVTRPVANAASVTDLSLTLRLNKSDYIFGEPVIATFVLSSSGQGNLQVPILGVDTSLHIDYRHESEGSFRKAMPVRESEFFGERLTPLPPTGLKTIVYLIKDLNRYRDLGGDTQERIITYLLAEGRYFFRGRYVTDSNENVVSNTVEVNVGRPSGVDVEAWEAWKNPSILVRMGDGGLEEERAVGEKKLTEFIAKYPNSVYAEYGRQRLAGESDLVRGSLFHQTTTVQPNTSLSSTSSASGSSSDQPVSSETQTATRYSWIWGLGGMAAIAVVMFALRRKAKA